MNDLSPLVFVVGGIIALCFVIWLLKKLLKSIPPMSKEQVIQHEINKIASDPIRSFGKKKSRFWWIVIIILLILLFSWIWLGHEFHP